MITRVDSSKQKELEMKRKKSLQSDTAPNDFKKDKGAVAKSAIEKYLPSWLSQFICVTLWEPVSPASLAVFRIIWGLIMFYETTTYMEYDWGKLHYIMNLRYRFKYYGFEWVDIWPGNGMYYHIYLMLFTSALITLGLFYRIAAAAFFFLFAWLYLQEMTLYLNHFYLVCIICFLFTFVDCSSYWSLDASFRGKRKKTIEYWNVWVFQILIAIVYTYAALCKVNEDWLRGEPLLHWLPKRSGLLLIGPLLGQRFTAYLFSWCGLLLDLSAGPALLHPVTRPLITPFVCSFHLLNKIIFNIGIFPWMMLASTTIFFSPEWPLRVLSMLFYAQDLPKKKHQPPTRRLDSRKIVILIFLSVFLLHQILVPLRHYTYPGNVNWTEEGHRWSWRMKLRDKSGDPRFYVHPRDSDKAEEVDLRKILTVKQIDKMSCRPELLHLFAHAIAEAFEKKHGYWPKVTATAICSLNHRPYQHMIKPGFDLASVPPWTWPNEWVVPLVPLGTNQSEWFATPRAWARDDDG